MSTRLPHEVYNEARRWYVEHAKSPEETSALMGGAPAPSTLYKLAAHRDRHGKTWKDYREEARDALYHATSPAAMVDDMLRDVREVLRDMPAGVKKADALLKSVRAIAEIGGPRLQLPVLYDLLEQLVLFLQGAYPDVLTPRLVAALRDFKNQSRARLGD